MQIFDLTGRRALITGSSMGIGLTLARGLARAGARVVLNARNSDRLEAAAQGLREEGYDAVASAFDVTDPDAVSAGVSAIENDGAIDILVNNAGIQLRTPL